MQRSKIEVFIHYVWATKNREHFLENANIERRIHRLIQSRAEKFDCAVLAVNGMPDHVHLLVKIPATVTLAQIAQEVKGRSSTFARAKLFGGDAFGWQDNYAGLSVTPRQVPKIISYIELQKQHHAQNILHPRMGRVRRGVRIVIFGSNSWPRPRFQPGGGDAVIGLRVCGEFPSRIATDFALDGIEIRVQANDFARFGESATEMLRQSNPLAAPAIESAPQMVWIRGVVPDPPDLEYLRQTLGFIHELLQNGGVGVVDPLTLQLFSPLEWQQTFWSGAFEPTSHTAIMLSPEGDKVALYTQGMKLFGRPDLSCLGVKPEEVEKLQPVFNGLIRMQAAGALIPEGQRVQAVGIENQLICRHRGRRWNGDFSNAEIALEWEGERL